MKFAPSNSRRTHRMPPSVACKSLFFLLAAGLFAALTMQPARAEVDPVIAKVHALAGEHLSDGKYAKAIAELVASHPKKAKEIIVEAVQDQPTAACPVLTASLTALKEANSNLDEQGFAKLVASILGDVVHAIE